MGLVTTIVLVLGAAPAVAQHDHSAHASIAQQEAPAADLHAQHSAPVVPIDHAETGHAPAQAQKRAADHATMGHAAPASAGTSQITHTRMDRAFSHADARSPATGSFDERDVDRADVGHADMDHTGMDHAAMGHGKPPASREPLPALTAADRTAAFPELDGHVVHDDAIHRYVLFNRLEGWNADHGSGFGWEGQAWFGTDLRRVWVRSEGERVAGATESGDLELLYGYSFHPWWDVVAGLRHDFAPGDSRDLLAIGVIGLAPYKFEVEATAYLGESGQASARIEVEYETLLTNRLILQSLVEAELFGHDDVRRGTGSGLSTVEAGLRLRYEFDRQFAPYVGIVRERAFGATADFRHAAGEGPDDTRVVAGVRIWF